MTNNQIRAVDEMVNYIVNYQNNYVSSFLFLKNVLPEFLEKGIKCEALLNSAIFYRKLDFEEWPTSHRNDTAIIRPYTGSIFKIRANYKSIFHGDEFKTFA